MSHYQQHQGPRPATESSFSKGFGVTCGVILAIIMGIVIIVGGSCVACTTCVASIPPAERDKDRPQSTLHKMMTEPDGGAREGP